MLIHVLYIVVKCLSRMKIVKTYKQRSAQDHLLNKKTIQ